MTPARPRKTSDTSGVERAAMLLLALGEDHGAEVWQFLDDEEIRLVTTTMTQLGTVTPEQFGGLIEEFATALQQASMRGDYENTERLLRRLLPEDRVDQIMDEVRGPAGRSVWQKLNNVQDTLVANYLKNEHPQTAAVVLSKLATPQIAKVLTLLPADLASDITHRMVRLDEIPKKTVEAIETTLRAEFISALGRSAKRDRLAQVADVFNHLGRDTESRIALAMEEIDPKLVERIRAQMFNFDRLMTLDPASMQTLIRAADTRMLATALKGASADMMEVVLRNMSRRAGVLLTDEIAALGPLRLRQVDEAQRKIVALARELEAKGEILIPSAAGEEMLV